MNFQSKLMCLSLFNSKSKDLKGLPKKTSGSLQMSTGNIFTVSIIKYLTVNLYTQLLYDKKSIRLDGSSKLWAWI